MTPEVKSKLSEAETIQLIHGGSVEDAQCNQIYLQETQPEIHMSSTNNTIQRVLPSVFKRFIMFMVVVYFSSLLALNLSRGVEKSKSESFSMSDNGSQSTSFYGLDLYVIGFNKCGTGSLRDLLRNSDGIAMLGRENNDLFHGTPKKALATLDSHFKDLLEHNETLLATERRAIKNPGGIIDMKSIKALVEHTSRDTKLILGLRHPVAFFQSFCNFRISCEKRYGEQIMSVDECHSRYFHLTRYDLYMKQLAKADLSVAELNEMTNHSLELAANPYKIFIYHLEQMADKNETRAKKLRSDFQDYAQLQSPITSWPRNKVDREKVIEEIDICEPKFYDLRQELIANGHVASNWIRDKFRRSDDVVIGGHEGHFLEILESWKEDVC